LGTSLAQEPFKALPCAEEEILAVLEAACGEGGGDVADRAEGDKACDGAGGNADGDGGDNADGDGGDNADGEDEADRAEGDNADGDGDNAGNGKGGASAIPEKNLTGNAFTKETLAELLNTDSGALHIASPFRLLFAHPALSELLLGDGKTVPLDRITALSRPDAESPDLVTLSGCETFPERYGADGSEVEILGELFQGMGVPSVLASLWRADGLSATALMREFYRLRFKEGLGKAEALQGAQKSLMHAGPVRSHP
jgi:hypothetical protein